MAETDKVVKLRDQQGPKLAAVALIEPPSRFGSAHLVDLKPTRLGAILRQAERGTNLVEWHELCDKMVESDDHLRAVVETSHLPVQPLMELTAE